MDRSLKWRTLILIGITLFCIATLAPSFVPKESLPTWFTSLFSKRINLGLDLQGGKHIVYNIDLDKAVDDYASEIKRDLESRIADEKIAGTVRTPATPLGAITVVVPDATKRAALKEAIQKDYGSNVEARACNPGDDPNAICFRVSTKYSDDIKSAALKNAVSTIRERINERGVAEPTVVEKGDDIIVELPGDPKSDAVVQTEELIKRTAKLEMKVVDDCTTPGPQGCTSTVADHSGSIYMANLYKHVGSDRKNNPTDPEAIRLDIKAEIDQWRPEEGGTTHSDYYLLAPDRTESVPVAWAKKKNKLFDKTKIEGDKVPIAITGREVIERYLLGDKDLGYKGLVETDPSFKVPEDHQLGFELIEPKPDAKDQHTYWRTYYLERAVRLTGSGISNASPSYDPNTGRPVVLLDFNRFGGRIFGDVTSQIVGMKFATILDDKVKSAPIINGAIRGGRASITMGGSDPTTQERERDALVAVLKTGSLPAPLREASHSDVGPTLGRDAIDKTKMSFAIGIFLVILIMVGIYKWSGFIAVFAVVFHIIMTLAVMALFGATLTLPGIAAIVLSIGMEVDGNILIYERIRDELLLGKSVRGAIDLGFSRAFSAILDGQLTTAAAGWVLLQYGSGPIKGFAVMLLVGVFTTLTTNIWVTRILFDWNVARKKGQLVTLSI
jgi:preprotein translocase subunit SecD